MQVSGGVLTPGFDFDINHSQGPWPRLALSLDGSAITASKKGSLEIFFRRPQSAIWERSGLYGPDWRKYPLVADPHVAGRFFCGGGVRPVHESTDGGRTWHVYEPLKGRVCKSIAFDRHVAGSVIFGCLDGIYVSSDGGATIKEFPDGLTVPSGTSRNVLIDRGRVFFMTSGSGVWQSRLQ